MKPLIATALLAVLIAPAAWLQAQSNPSGQQEPPVGSDVALRPEGQTTPADLKSLELEFVVLDEHSLAVVVAEGEFSASADLTNVGGEMHIRIDGTVRPLQSDDRWLMSFSATMHRNDLENDNDATFTAAGSAVVTLNSKVTLARLPGPDLSVTVRPAREQPAD